MSNRTNIPTEPCEGCGEVKECEVKGHLSPCRAFRIYTNKVHYHAKQWTPEDRGVFDR